MSDVKPDLAGLRIDRAVRGSAPGWLFWVSVVLVVAVGAFAAWWYFAGSAVKPVRAATVLEPPPSPAGGRDTVLNASGDVTARRRATVSSKITGKVVEVHVEEGMAVRNGQVLARLDDAMARANLALAEAQLDAAWRAATESEVRLEEAKRTLERRTERLKNAVIGKAV